MMRLFLLALIGILCLASCSKERGLEHETPAEFGTVVYPQFGITSVVDVLVKADVTCPYGLARICIGYVLDEKYSVCNYTTPQYYTEENTSVSFEGFIPKQKAGVRVEFWVVANTTYGVESYSEIYEYTVAEPSGVVSQY